MLQSFHLKIISPAEIIVDDQVPQVEIPGVEGDFGVLPGHSPLFSMIRPGVINVKLPDGNSRKFFAQSGYADVTPDSCTVISDHIQDLASISESDAHAALVEAKTAVAKADTAAERQQAEKLLQAAEALNVALKGNH
jgi:F-type H+-transporting ATPase subunit epsilon